MLSEDNPLRASTPGVRDITPPVMIDPETFHFQLDMGFKLFEDGELTPFLQKRIDRMQMDAKHEQRTLALIDLLHCAGVLEPANVRHQGKKIACYLVNDKALSTNLVKAATDSDSIGQAGLSGPGHCRLLERLEGRTQHVAARTLIAATGTLYTVKGREFSSDSNIKRRTERH